MAITPEILNKLQLNPSCIRNICILAHVDHGKTTLSDSLLSTNGIISQRMAGKVRYLDSRPDEQLRGITMESSAISLYFRLLRRKLPSKDDDEVSQVEPVIEEHLINLIDSPGHIDFSSEVSVASRLCDGALVLVDVVEGIQSQTVTVLRQAWNDKLKPVLVLNKIDRLIIELKMSPSEAYTHLKKIVEQANVVIGSFFAGERMIEDEIYRENLEKDGQAEFVGKDDKDLYFHPEKNNVIFGSAIDGWGFTIQQLAAFYEKKLGFKRENLQKVLWGDFYLDPKTKKVINYKGLKGRKNLKPLFVQLILENIWKIYENTVTQESARDPEVLNKIVKALNIKVLPRDLRSKDTKNLLKTIMSQWLPISSSILVTVVEQLQSPIESQAIRIPAILDVIPNSEMINEELKQSMLACDNNGPVSCYVSKMISVPDEDLPDRNKKILSANEMAELGRIAREKARKVAEQARALEDDKKLNDGLGNMNITTTQVSSNFDDFGDFEDEDFDDFDFGEPKDINVSKETLIGFARIYSGTLKIGSKLTVLSPKYDPLNPSPEHISELEIEDLYLLMGRELVCINEVPAGNIVGIGGLAGKLHKNGTLVSSSALNKSLSNGINLSAVSTLTAIPPIVQVAVEPVNPLYLDQLSHGLKLLCESDPVVETYLNDKGENILCCSGELHLERCLNDLKERFVGVEIQASEPSIPYRETIVGPEGLSSSSDANAYEGFGSNEINPIKHPEFGGRGHYVFTLNSDDDTSKAIEFKISVKPLPAPITSYLNTNIALINSVMNLKSKQENIKKLEDDLSKIIDVQLNSDEIKKQISKNKDNFYNATEDIKASIINNIVTFGPKRIGPNLLIDKSGKLSNLNVKQTLSFEGSIINGFQLAMMEGPLASEPVEGVSVFIEEINFIGDEDHSSIVASITNLAGKLLRQTKDSIHQAFLDWSPRLMLAMYSCDIQATSEVLGKVYAVIQKRRGRIISEEMKEGTLLFSIKAKIPVIEAFGFSEEFRKKTSGAAIPQLVFNGYEIINEDPFWVPKTEEELEALGEFAERENMARKYINTIRKSKGLFVDEITVKNAEKQRTLRKD
ncbi:GTPase [Saccharomycopsis crataegensis]|uniref:Ribosome assembly protein 1 n=1 Tax=Saccharomycopsis crataegensis TaxID=43959 RepID=A0AAV5QU12_9ASCO|nr:GTPase [Saccharomycopsis crataegensis]